MRRRREASPGLGMPEDAARVVLDSTRVALHEEFTMAMFRLSGGVVPNMSHLVVRNTFLNYAPGARSSVHPASCPAR